MVNFVTKKPLDKPHVLDDATLNRVFELYNNQLADQQFFGEQFSRWRQGHLSDAEAKEIKGWLNNRQH